MRHIHDDAELAAAVDRYVRPDNRYLQLLHGNFLRLGGSERTNFVQSLVAAARQATLPELTVLLEGEWRARLTGAVLASFGTPQDAAVLTQYLDHYLPQAQLRYDQPWALGALLHIDERLRNNAAR